MSDTFKQKLIDYTQASNLEPEQKKLWELFTKISSPEEDEAVFEAVSGSEENLKLLTGFLRDKIFDMKSRNENAWNKMLAEYGDYVQSLM